MTQTNQHYTAPADWSELAELETQASPTPPRQTFVPAFTPAQQRQDDAAALMAALQRGAAPVIDVTPVWTPVESRQGAGALTGTALALIVLAVLWVALFGAGGMP